MKYIIGTKEKMTQIFTEEGEVSLEVSLIEPIKNNQGIIKFSIKDTGIGISRQQQNNLFEAYLRCFYLVGQ